MTNENFENDGPETPWQRSPRRSVRPSRLIIIVGVGLVLMFTSVFVMHKSPAATGVSAAAQASALCKNASAYQNDLSRLSIIHVATTAKGPTPAQSTQIAQLALSAGSDLAASAIDAATPADAQVFTAAAAATANAMKAGTHTAAANLAETKALSAANTLYTNLCSTKK